MNVSSRVFWLNTVLEEKDEIISNRPFGYERVYLPLWKVADTPFHIQGDEMYQSNIHLYVCFLLGYMVQH